MARLVEWLLSGLSQRRLSGCRFGLGGRMRRIPPKVARNVNAKVHNFSRWAFWVALFVLALAAYAVWTTHYIYSNSPYVTIGKSVDCHTRPFPKALRCNPRIDGIDCDVGSRNWLKEWHEPIDYACALSGPDPVFVFSTYRDLNWDEETISIMIDILNYIEDREPETLEVAEATPS